MVRAIVRVAYSAANIAYILLGLKAPFSCSCATRGNSDHADCCPAIAPSDMPYMLDTAGTIGCHAVDAALPSCNCDALPLQPLGTNGMRNRGHDNSGDAGTALTQR